MKMALGLIPLAISLLAGPSPAAGGDKPEAAELARHAKEVSDLKAPGSPPFHLEAKLQLFRAGRPEIDGAFIIDWASREVWREELTLPGYQSLKVTHDEQSWGKHDGPYEPLLLHRIETGLGDYPGENPGPAGKVQERSEGGVRLTCSVKKTPDGKTEYCVDAATGRLVLQSGVFSFEYSDFLQVGAKWFPQAMRVLVGGKLVAEAQVAQISTTGNLSPSLFARPDDPGVIDLSDCKGGNFRPAASTYRPNPPYPPQLRQAREQGRVVVWAVVGADGRLYDLTIVHSAGADLDAVALDTMRQWRYSPASCKGTPIDVETELNTTFALR